MNQPSGIDTDGTVLYFADPEASAIRTADLDPAGNVATIVWTGLFDFGDQDGVGDDVLDQVFDFLVRDVSKFALQLYSKTSSTSMQRFFCRRMIRKPVVDHARFGRVWEEHVIALRGAYRMNG